MSLITRQGKGEKLTIQEMDDNLTYLEGLARPYKVYTALLTQSGTAAPIATVLENTFTGSISFAYASTGIYEIVSSANEFVLNKTLTQIQLWGDDPKTKGRVGNVQFKGTDKLLLRNSNAVEPGSLTNGIGTNDIITSIEIRVYP